MWVRIRNWETMELVKVVWKMWKDWPHGGHLARPYQQPRRRCFAWVPCWWLRCWNLHCAWACHASHGRPWLDRGWGFFLHVSSIERGAFQGRWKTSLGMRCGLLASWHSQHVRGMPPAPYSSVSRLDLHPWWRFERLWQLRVASGQLCYQLWKCQRHHHFQNIGCPLHQHNPPVWNTKALCTRRIQACSVHMWTRPSVDLTHCGWSILWWL